MTDVFRHAWWAFAQVYYDLRALAVHGNLLWFLTVLPFVPLVGLPASNALQQAVLQTEGALTGLQYFVFIVGATVTASLLAGPGTAGLFWVAQRYCNKEDVAPRDFWVGFRTGFWRSWILLVIDLFLLYGLIVGFFFYTGTGQIVIQALGFLSLYFVVLWVAAQAYIFPLAVRFDMSLFQVFRNAAVMALSAPGTSIAFFLLTAVILTLSVLLLFPCVFLTAITMALTATRMTEDRLRTFGFELFDSEA